MLTFLLHTSSPTNLALLLSYSGNGNLKSNNKVQFNLQASALDLYAIVSMLQVTVFVIIFFGKNLLLMFTVRLR
jgi:hypothetical protein